MPEFREGDLVLVLGFRGLKPERGTVAGWNASMPSMPGQDRVLIVYDDGMAGSVPIEEVVHLPPDMRRVEEVLAWLTS